MKTYPVLVGVDGTESSKQAVRWAAREAQRRNRQLLVTHVFGWERREAHYDMSQEYLSLSRKHAEGIVANAAFEARGNAHAVDVETPDQDAVERNRLSEQLAPWQAKYPETRVDMVLTHDSAAGALVEASRHAQLVVVGSRGHGVIAGSLIGSVGPHLLHHAECPVYLARPAS